MLSRFVALSVSLIPQVSLLQTLDPTCTHAIDQGVICQVADSPQARNQALTDPCHHNTAGRGALYQADHQQPIIFACVEFYSTQCVYDVTNEELRNGMGSYMRAMRAFGECAEVIPEPAGTVPDPNRWRRLRHLLKTPSDFFPGRLLPRRDRQRALPGEPRRLHVGHRRAGRPGDPGRQRGRRRDHGHRL